MDLCHRSDDHFRLRCIYAKAPATASGTSQVAKARNASRLLVARPDDYLFHIIWIITEADRSATTILLAAEY
jgi:hypothetical protein